ncbi:MAG: META domain-containing protein [Pseudomonadota bacterium]
MGRTIRAAFAAIALMASPASAGGLDGAWRIVEISGVDDGVDHAGAEFILLENGRAAMSLGCNRMSATPRIDGERIAFGPVIGTRRGCPPPLGEAEAAFIEALRAARMFRIDETDRRAQLLDETDAARVTLERAD